MGESFITKNSIKKIDYKKEYTHEYENETNEQSELINTQTDMDHTPRKNDVHKNKYITQTKLDNNPWKIVLQNTQGLITKNSDKKLKMIKEYTKEEKIMAMNFTETHYTGTIKESANIEGYNIFRCDRKKRKGGGVAIYLHEKVEAEIICEIRHKGCEMVAINIPELQTINIVVYRPPDTIKIVFDKILDEIEKICRNTPKPEPTLILSGDFNFPFVKWNRMPSGACTWKYKTEKKETKPNISNDTRMQFVRLMEICDENCMLQVVEEETRGRNTLDLIYTNEVSLVTDIDVNESDISDHHRIEISTNYKIKEEKIQQNKSEKKDTMTSLNFHAKENKINWDMIKKGVKDIEWRKICEDGDAIEIIVILLNMLNILCTKEVPRKKNKEGNNRGKPKEVKKLLNRIKMLKRKKRKAYSKEKKKIFESRILETEKEKDREDEGAGEEEE